MLLFPVSVFALAVFPGAEGFGTDWVISDWPDTTPDIYIINTTNPTTAATELSAGEKSERNLSPSGFTVYFAGIKTAMQVDTPRIIVFEISGVSAVNGLINVRYNGAGEDGRYMILAGQTAPDPGFTLRGATVWLASSYALVQHIRIRPGDGSGYTADQRDGIQVNAVYTTDPNIESVVIDHVSIAWAIDGSIDIKSSGGVSDSTTDNVTVSNCIIGEHLNDSIHGSGEHSFASITSNVAHLLYKRNLFAHNVSRNPQMNCNTGFTCGTILANNVIYNHDNPIMTGGPTSTGEFDINMQGNVSIEGNDSDTTPAGHAFLANNIDNSGTDEYYMGAGDYRNDCTDYVSDPTDCVHDVSSGALTEVGSPTITVSPLTILAYSETQSHVLNNAGAYPQFRDTVDTGIVADVSLGQGYIVNCVDYDSGNTSCDSYDEVAEEATDGGSGWNRLSSTENARVLQFPSNPYGDSDSDGYTNIEEWLHGYSAAVEGSTHSVSSVRLQ
ncbi:MAG: hypothetical protein GWN00_21135 [Aliifodinibius sp.]|nr:hypothetical protein [Fodinibius sp.]NIY27219.1 hypothetical protein [Fodinibius sp.]